MNRLYSEINNSFKKKLVYNLGSEAGFFSEYNNMILAILFCLKNGIRFELYSLSANFASKFGWQDYFEPFCIENLHSWHHKYNFRQPDRNVKPIIQFKTYIYKIISKTEYLTYDLWNEFHNKNFEQEFFDIPILGINGSTRQVSNKIIELTWRYNTETAYEINSLLESIKLPSKYLGMHIRGGDKSIESKTFQVEEYMNYILNNSNLQNIFVLTDDYRNIDYLEDKYPDFNFYYFCKKCEEGYNHDTFTKMDKHHKRNSMLRLFASMDILAKSELFVGTFSSNPGMYLGMRMEIEKVKGLDFDTWCIW